MFSPLWASVQQWTHNRKKSILVNGHSIYLLRMYKCAIVGQASVLQWIRLVYFSGPLMTLRPRFSPIVGLLKYTRRLVYFSGLGQCTLVNQDSVLQWIRLVYFGGPLMTFRARFSSIVDPLKYTRFYKVREKKTCVLYIVDHKNGNFLSFMTKISIF